MSVAGLQRIRVGYEQGNRPAFWLLLALFAFVVLARHLPPLAIVGRLDDHLLTIGELILALPLLFAAAILLLAPGRKLLVAGALLLAAGSVLWSMSSLRPLLPEELANPISYLSAAIIVAGPLLVGHGLGGVRTRLGVAIASAGAVLSIGAAVTALDRALPLVEVAGETGVLLMASSMVHQFFYLGWAYVLAAAIERRAMLISAGAGLLIATTAAFLVLDEVAMRQPPGSVLPGAGVLYLVLSLSAWLALILGVIREVDAVPDGEPTHADQAGA